MLLYQCIPTLQLGDPNAWPKGWVEPLEAPSCLDYGLTSDEQVMVDLHDRPRKKMSEEEREKMSQEVEEVRKEMFQIMKEKMEYQRDVNR